MDPVSHAPVLHERPVVGGPEAFVAVIALARLIHESGWWHDPNGWVLGAHANPHAFDTTVLREQAGEMLTPAR